MLRKQNNSLSSSEEEKTKNANFLKKHMVAISTTIIGILATTIIAVNVYENAHERAVTRFENKALLQYRAIENTINDGENALRSVNNLFITSWPVSRVQFGIFTNELLKRYEYVNNFSYDRVLNKEDRENFEQEVRQTFPNFKITDQTKDGIIESTEREKYLVTTYVQPSKLNDVILGRDMLNNLLYNSAISMGRDLGIITASTVLGINNKNESQNSIKLWMPLYQGGTLPNSIQERQNNLIGFTTATLHISDLINVSLRKLGFEKNNDIDIVLTDVTSKEQHFTLYGKENTNHGLVSKGRFDTPSYSKNILIGNREWNITLSPSEGSFYVDKETVLLTFISGTLLSLLFGVFIYNRQRLLEQEKLDNLNKLKEAEQHAILEQLHQESSRLTKIIEAQSEITRAEFDLNVFMHTAAEKLLKLTNADGASIEIKEGDHLRVVAAIGTATTYFNEEIKIENSLSGMCIKTNSEQLCTDTLNDPNANQEIVKKSGSRSVLVAPLMYSGETTGVFKILSSKVDAFDEREIKTLKVLANVVGTAIQQRLQADELFKEKELAQVTLSAIGDAVITTDIDANVTYLNPIAEKLTGWTDNEARGHSILTVFNIINERTRKTVSNPILNALQSNQIVGMEPDTLLISKKGKEYAVDDSAAPIFDREGKAIGAVLVFRDVSQERSLTQEITYQATHDTLTGILNRRAFNDKIESSLHNYRVSEKNSTLLYLDLDQFKIVNDTCGHAAGDDLLLQITTLLKANVRTQDTIARLGGDEFGILLEGCHTENAYMVAEALREKIQNYRFHWEGQVFNVGVSIGVVNFSSDSFDLKRLLSAADSACYIAKEKGRNQVCIYEPDAAEQTQRTAQMGWVVRLRKALEDEKFVLFVQPIVDVIAERNSFCHYEMLLRMYDEEGKLVPPMAFIPAAERYNMMSLIDKWVVKKSFEFANKHPKALCSINLSGQSMNDDKFLEFILSELKLQNVNCSQICFEITETAAIANFVSATKFIQELKNVGCSFALDDFGSGMSSFNYLKQLPVDYLKIDGGFVKNMARDQIDHAMVESINNIGHIMGLKTIAEFVEDDEILKKLQLLGVDYAQGYGIGKPVDSSTIIPKPSND